MNMMSPTQGLPQMFEPMFVGQMVEQALNGRDKGARNAAKIKLLDWANINAGIAEWRYIIQFMCDTFDDAQEHLVEKLIRVTPSLPEFDGPRLAFVFGGAFYIPPFMRQRIVRPPEMQ